ncbi:MAG: hypothetical protein GF334_06725 [Candidatus Altiarchaeales archaeon]|nr:hypothetical protein [Candidatus Altiarchaeales archaeon]
MEKCFIPSLSVSEARRLFEKKARFLGMLNLKGEVEQVLLGYTPVASYNLRKTARFNQSPRRVREWGNVFHVDLNNLEIYYCYRNPLTRETSVKSVSFLRQVVDLPSNALRLLSLFLESGEINVKNLGEEEKNFFIENTTELDLLVKRGLILVKQDGLGFLSHVRFTSPGDVRYDLGSFLEVFGSRETMDFVAPILNEPGDLLGVLTSVLGCEGFFEEIVYLPFYQCKYRKAESVYFERLLSAKLRGEDG